MASVGIVAEGTTEIALLEMLVRGFFPDSEVRQIHPDATLASAFGNGWRGVRAWCRENGQRLDTFMTGVEGDELDVLVIHADCSMAHNIGARRPCPPASDSADALQEVIRRDWLGLEVLPQGIVMMTPAESTDTWLFVGAGYGGDGAFDPIECSTAIEHELARLRHYRWKKNEIRKTRTASANLAESTVSAWFSVTDTCSEAGRFWGSLSAAMP